MRHSRGDLSKCGKKLFWAYRMGKEGWLDHKTFDEFRKRDLYLRKVAYMAPNLLEEARQQPIPQ